MPIERKLNDVNSMRSSVNVLGIILFSSLIFSQDTVHVNTNLFGLYKGLPILGGNLKPSIQPPWNQTDFLEHLSALQPQTLRWPGAEAANYFDWNKGTLMPCYKWTGVSYPFDHPDRDLCGQQNDLCNVDGSGVGSVQYPRSIQSELMNDTQRSANYVNNYASNYINVLKTIRENIDNKPLIPFFTLNVLSPEYHDPTSVIFDANCDVISDPVNTISQQLDSIAILSQGMDEIYIQLGNEPWYAKPYKETIWPNASAYFLKMIIIAQQIRSHPDPSIHNAKISLFADVHSDDIEDDDCINNNTSLRCAWNDSMHTILSSESAYNLFDAYSIHKYTGFKNIQIPDLDENCNPLEADWINYKIEEISNFNDCQMNYIIKWMIITRDQMFENFSGNNQYLGLYNSINGDASPKDIWITEYDIGLDDNDAFDKLYSNGWPHAIYNLYTTLKYIIEVPDIGVLIQNNILGYSGGYRLIDTYSYVDDEGTNNAKYHIYYDEGNEYRKLVSHKFIGLSPKGEATRILNELAWRNNNVTQIMLDPSEIDSTEIRGYQSTDSYYAKDIYGWSFDKGDYLFMNISTDTINIMLNMDNVVCSSYDFTIMGGDLYARNYQTESGSSLVYDTLSHNQVAIWEFDSENIVPSNIEQNHFSASYKMHISSGSLKDFHPTFNIPPNSVIQILKDNTFNENACDCDGNIDLGCGCGEDDSCLSINSITLPDQFSIQSIYPNPFNPITKITYGIPEYSNIQIIIFDLTGKQVASLINEPQSPGYHSINWNADYHPSGIYFVKMIADEYMNTQKLMLVK